MNLIRRMIKDNFLLITRISVLSAYNIKQYQFSIYNQVQLQVQLIKVTNEREKKTKIDTKCDEFEREFLIY